MASEAHLAKLKEGVASWNAWRESFDDCPDLTEANLSGADLRGADLSNANLQDAKLNFAKLNNAKLNNTILKNASLQNASLRNADLRNVILREADLSYADLHSANLTSATLTQATLHKANLSYTNVHKANLSYADLSYADLRKADFTQAILREASLKGAYLNNAILLKADLNNTNLSGADLNNTDLTRADLSGANLNGANLNGANLSQAFLRTTQVQGCNFTAATLTGACIHNWELNSSTQLDAVICQYVYLKAERSKDVWIPSDRRPTDLKQFLAPGEFAKLFQTEQATVDLIFAEGINWHAFWHSFQDVRSQYGDLSIQAIEIQPHVALIVRLAVPPTFNKTGVKHRIIEVYAREQQILETQYRKDIAATDQEIEQYRRDSANLSTVVHLLANQDLTSDAFRLEARASL